MQYINFKDNLKDFTVFSLADIRSIDSRFYRRRLNDWQEKGYIKKIIRGYYIFSDMKIDENVLFEIANRIYSPSYVSFEAALSYYGFIPESSYGITSASTRRTQAFKTPLAEFSYRTLKTGLFFGYNIIKYGAKNLKMASPEKAILDYFYINPSVNGRAAYAGLRINKKVFFDTVDRRKLSLFLKRFTQNALKKRIASFLEFIEND